MKVFADLVFVLFYSLTGIAQVGVGTDNPTIHLDVNGAISLREGTALNLIDNVYNSNIGLDASPYSTYRVIGPTTVFGISGIIPETGVDGQVIIIQNTTGATMIVAHENSFSTAENRILVPEERDIWIRGKDATITLLYSSSQNRWILTNKLNHIETWYSTNSGTVLFDSLRTTITVLDSRVTPTSSISVNLVNNHGLPNVEKYNLIVEYIEAQTGQFKFRVYNKNPDTRNGPQYSFVVVQYAFTINY